MGCASLGTRGPGAGGGTGSLPCPGVIGELAKVTSCQTGEQLRRTAAKPAVAQAPALPEPAATRRGRGHPGRPAGRRAAPACRAPAADTARRRAERRRAGRDEPPPRRSSLRPRPSLAFRNPAEKPSPVGGDHARDARPARPLSVGRAGAGGCRAGRQGSATSPGVGLALGSKPSIAYSRTQAAVGGDLGVGRARQRSTPGHRSAPRCRRRGSAAKLVCSGPWSGCPSAATISTWWRPMTVPAGNSQRRRWAGSLDNAQPLRFDRLRRRIPQLDPGRRFTGLVSPAGGVVGHQLGDHHRQTRRRLLKARWGHRW